MKLTPAPDGLVQLELTAAEYQTIRTFLRAVDHYATRVIGLRLPPLPDHLDRAARRRRR